MKKVKLGEFVNIRQGLAINKASSHLVSKKQNETFIYPLLKIADMIENKFSKFISSNVNKNVIATNDDIIYTRTGKVGLVFRKFQGVVHNNSFIVSLKNNNMNKNYLYYILQSSFVKKQAIELSKTSVQPDLAHSKFKSIKIPFIDDINTQEKIANILSNIDDKIENNNKISAKLEQMAKLIYDYYFVQFDYPDENGKPYKSSGGAMKYNEILKREIPINWEVINSSERLKFTRGIEPGSSEYKSKNYNNVKFYKVGDMLNDANVYIDKKFAELAYAKENDLLVSFDGSVGRIGLGLNGVYSSGIQKISDKNNEISTSILWLMFSSTEFQQIINRYATGSNILHASLSIKYLNFAYNNKIFSKFSKISNPIFNKIIEVKKENQKLSSLRDFLLPMLMNGQVSFKN